MFHDLLHPHPAPRPDSLLSLSYSCFFCRLSSFTVCGSSLSFSYPGDLCCFLWYPGVLFVGCSVLSCCANSAAGTNNSKQHVVCGIWTRKTEQVSGTRREKATWTTHARNDGAEFRHKAFETGGGYATRKPNNETLQQLSRLLLASARDKRQTGTRNSQQQPPTRLLHVRVGALVALLQLAALAAIVRGFHDALGFLRFAWPAGFAVRCSGRDGADS
jgi:hypothetical protein